MRPSLLKHVVAILRTTAGLTQKELADLAGCAVATIQSVELGRLKLSEPLARRLAERTGADLACLLRNQTRQPVQDRCGRPYTRDAYERCRAEEKFLRARPEGLADAMADYLFLWVTFKRHLRWLAEGLAHSYLTNNSRLFAYKADRALLDLSREFMASLDPDEAGRMAGFAKEQADLRNASSEFFLNGLPEALLFFQEEIDQEFRKRVKGVPWGDFGKSLEATRACLVQFRKIHERSGHATCPTPGAPSGRPPMMAS